jgi:hypothetical protein
LNHRTLLLLVFILLSSATLGANRLHVPSFSSDEIATIHPAIVVSMRFTPRNGLSLYTFFLGWWRLLLGQSEVVARWPSLMFGLLSLAITFRLAARHISVRIGLLALVVLASSAVFVRYYREAAPHTFAVCLSVFSVLCLVNWRRHRRRIDLIRAILTGGLVMVVYLSSTPPPTSGPVSPVVMLDGLVRALTNDNLGLFIVLIAVAVIRMLSVHKQRDLRANLATIGFALLCLSVPQIGVLIALGAPRTVLIVWPAMALITAFGIDAISPRAARLVVVTVLIGIGIAQVANDLSATLPGAYQVRYWREVFSTIATNAYDKDFFVPVNLPDVALAEVIPPMVYYHSFVPNKTISLTLSSPPQDYPGPLVSLWLLMAGGYSDVEPYRQEIDAWQARLREVGYVQCRTWMFSDQTMLAEWKRLRGPFYEFGQQIAMKRTPLDPMPTRYQSGAMLDMALGFQALQRPTLNYSVGVYVMSESGQIVAQQDGPVAGQQTSTWQPGDTFCALYSIAVPATRGKYTVRVAIYDWADNKRLSVSPSVGETDAAPVLTFTVD